MVIHYLFEAEKLEKIKDEKKAKKDIENTLKKIEDCVKKGEYKEAARLYKFISRIAFGIKDGKALDYILESAKCSIKSDDFFEAGLSYKNASIIAREQEKSEDSVRYALQAAEYFLKSKSVYGAQWSYNLAGSVCEERKDFKSAIKFYAKSLDLEKDEEVEGKTEFLTSLISHPEIRQIYPKTHAKEGENLIFKLNVKNKGNEFIKDVRIFDSSMREVCYLPGLKPNEEKMCEISILARETGLLTPPYEFVSWKINDDVFRKKIKPEEMDIMPNIAVQPYLKNKLKAGHYSFFAVLVKNISMSSIHNVKLNINFPFELKTKTMTGEINTISSGEEKGFVFKILPTVVGKTIISNAELLFEDADSRKRKQKIQDIVLEEVFETEKELPVKTEPLEALSKEKLDKIGMLQENKKEIYSFFSPYTITESEYVDLTKKLKFFNEGCSLKGVDIETASSHILEECKAMGLVSMHKFDDERLFLFSGKSADDEVYLLTAVAKKTDHTINIGFKMYSGKEEGLKEILSKIASVVKYTVLVMNLATEVEKTEVKEVINIIDSVVQRSRIGLGKKGKLKDKKIRLEDSIVQRDEI